MTRACVGVSFCVCLAATAAVYAQGHPAAEAAQRMQVPPGLEVRLVASEPLVRQPVCIEFDDRGRLWAIQYLQYPNPAGLTRTKVDRFSRTEYDRLPEPPPKGPVGADRITILEDTDGDGVADKGHDFVAGLNLTSGLAFGYGGVFVLQTPYLLFYPDRNRDDVPDADPEVLLTGFGMDDAHSVANSLTWGPDGWLYGCQGSTVTARIRGIEFQQGVWRYHPLSHEFELYCEGGGNSWGLDFDRHGRLLYSTNHGGYRLLHGLPGAYYWKSFGKHGPLHNPFAFGYFDHAPHRDFRGGHVTVGGIVYRGDGLPAMFRDTYISADLLGHGMHWNEIQPRGSTVATAHAGDFLIAHDTWFAPSDVTTGPDGAVYVCDWHDSRTAHPDPDAEWDRSNGRIYRIAMKSTPLAPALRGEGPGVRGSSKDTMAMASRPSDLRTQSTASLIALHSHLNDWFVRRARRILTERRDPEAILPLRTMVASAMTPQLRLEALWTLACCGGLTDRLAIELLHDGDPFLRRATVQLLGDAQPISAQIVRALMDLAPIEPDVAVRAQLACTARRLPSVAAIQLVQRLAARNEDQADPFAPLLLWWAIEQHADTERAAIVEWLCDSTASTHQIVRQTILPRFLRRSAAVGDVPSLKAVAQILNATRDRAAQLPLLASIEQGWQERRANGPIPEEFTESVRVLWREDASDEALLRLAMRLHFSAARQRVSELLSDRRASEADRKMSIGIMADLGSDADAQLLTKLVLDEQEPAGVRLAAIDAVQRFALPDVGDVLLKVYPSSKPPLKERLQSALLGRPEWGTRFLDEFEAKRLPVTDLTAERWQGIVNRLDPESRGKISRLWGRVSPPTPEERLAEVRRLNNDLRAGTGSAEKGHPLFTQHCATCHRLHGEGYAVGPDLTHANRADRDYLLVQLVDPNAIIRKEYVTYIAATKDGRVLTGLLVEQNAGGVTLLAAKAEKLMIAASNLDELRESDASLMPENVLKKLTPQELRDLFAFLQSAAPKTENSR